MKKFFTGDMLNSRIRSPQVEKSEKILGYFVGPCLVYMVYSAVAGTYLTQFYTDVLGLAGGFLTMMPLLSKILSSLTGLLIGRMIDRTRTKQGKARPWILASGLMLTICGVLLYAVPKASQGVRIAWAVISYNLFFGLAFSVYSLSHSLMVPLSTRDVKQRDTLAMLTSTGTSMIPGMLSTIIMPVLVSKIGVGAEAQGHWITLMGLLSVLAIPAVLVEYYFTLERVTAETEAHKQQTASFKQQIHACLKDKYWLMVIALTLVLNLCNSFSTSSMLYYCNWVLGSSVESGAGKQILVNMIGQAPLGYGVFLLWPLVKKFGKRRVAMVGFSLAAAGSLLALLQSDNLIMVLICLFIKSMGAIPTYIMASLLAEALDHVEWKQGFRADGFSASVNSMVQTIALGIAQTVLLAGIHGFGYIVPETAAQTILQPEAVRNFFSWCFVGMPMLGYGIGAVLMFFYKIEGKMPEITRAIARKNEEKNGEA